MSKKGNPLEAGHHAAQEYLRHCRLHPNYAGERQTGSHVHVNSKNGRRVTIPDHHGNLNPGTEVSIRKQMRLAGFLALALVAAAILILL